MCIRDRDVAGEFHKFGIDKPEVLPTDASLMQRIHNRMLRAQIEKLDGRDVYKRQGKGY